MCNKLTLRAWRSARDITQEELAELAGLSRKTIVVYETVGLGQAKADTLMKLIDILDIDFNQLDLESSRKEVREHATN